MLVFSNVEKIDIVAVYREANNNALEARRRYAQRYPDRRLPSRAVFARTEVTLRVHGTFHPPIIGNKRVVDDPELRRAVVNQVEDNPHVGQRGIAATLETSQKSVGRILKSEEFHPFKVHLTQELHGDDFRNRVNFCTFIYAATAA